MAITEMKHVPENRRVQVVLKSGSRIWVRVLNNDRADEVLWCDAGEAVGLLQPIGYGLVDRVLAPATEDGGPRIKLSSRFAKPEYRRAS